MTSRSRYGYLEVQARAHHLVRRDNVSHAAARGVNRVGRHPYIILQIYTGRCVEVRNNARRRLAAAAAPRGVSPLSSGIREIDCPSPRGLRAARLAPRRSASPGRARSFHFNAGCPLPFETHCGIKQGGAQMTPPSVRWLASPRRAPA